MCLESAKLAMMNKRNLASQKVILWSLLALSAVALFPPRQQSGTFPYSAGRGFLFNPDFSSVTVPTSYGGRVELYEINTGRLLAEALLITALTGFALISVWSEDA